jgi:hypothetical protein
MNIIRYKPRSGIESWGAWPEDVQEILQKFNKKGKLTFARIYGTHPILAMFNTKLDTPIFQCELCKEWHEPAKNGVAIYCDTAVCDFCMITIARLENKNE